MTGEIIHLQSHRDLKRSRSHRKQAVSHRAAAAPRLKEPMRSRASVESGSRILRTEPWSERSADIADDGEGDPQPAIDCETLDRMYRVLNSDA